MFINIVCVHHVLWVACVPQRMYTDRLEDGFMEGILSFLYGGHGDQTQVFRLGWKVFYLLSRLVSLRIMLKRLLSRHRKPLP